MSYVTTITVFLIMLSNQLSANNREGQMDCKVKTNRVIQIEEGIGKEFTGFSDSFSTGDELRLTYTYNTHNLAGYDLTIKLRDNERQANHWLNKSNSFDEREFVAHNEGTGAGIKGVGAANWFHQDIIRSEGLHVIDTDGQFRMMDGELYLFRYYKNDWNGLIFSHSLGKKLHAYTIDCRHTVDQLDEIINALLKAQNKFDETE